MLHILDYCTLLPPSPSLSDLPAAPGPAVATRNTDTSVVVSWGASKDVKHLVGYYINYTVAGSDVWTPANNKPVKGTRYITL